MEIVGKLSTKDLIKNISRVGASIVLAAINIGLNPAAIQAGGCNLPDAPEDLRVYIEPTAYSVGPNDSSPESHSETIRFLWNRVNGSLGYDFNLARYGEDKNPQDFIRLSIIDWPDTSIDLTVSEPVSNSTIYDWSVSSKSDCGGNTTRSTLIAINASNTTRS